MSKGQQWPGGCEDDHCEKDELGGRARSLALRVAFAHKAKRAQTHGDVPIKQLTVPPIAA